MNMPIVINSALTNEADNLTNYTKQQFHSGDVLWASQLNAMDDQIAANATAILQKLNAPEVAGTSGQVLTSDGSGSQSWQTPTDSDGMTSEVKLALLAIARKVAYIDDSGYQLYLALYRAMNGGAVPTLSSISTNLHLGSHVVYEGDTLDSLKPYLTVTTSYTDGSEVPISSGNYTLSGTLTQGTSVVTVSHSSKTTTFNVTVSAPVTLSSISASLSLGTHVVHAGDSLDSLKPYLTVTATYSNSNTETVNASDYTLSGDLSSAGTATVTVTYQSKTDTVSVTVVAPATLSSISASFDSSHIVYEGDSLDSLKPYLTVTATYDDSSTTAVSSNDYTLSGTLTEGTSTVTVSYGGKTTTFTVTVEEAPPAALSSISAALNLNGTIVRTTDSLNSLKSYLTVTATYDDNSSTTINASNYTLNGNMTAGTQTITVSYGGKTTTFQVTVHGGLTLDRVTLPSGYTQIEAIISNQTQYANLNVLPSAVSRAQYGVQLVTESNNYHEHILSASATFYPYFKAGTSSKTVEAKNAGNTNISSGDKTFNWTKDTDYAVDAAFPDVKVNGTTLYTISAGTSTDTNSIFLCGYNDNGTPSRRSSIRVYYLKFYDTQSQLAHNYVPCTNSSNVAGLYDTVAEEFIASSAETAFAAGEVL